MTRFDYRILQRNTTFASMYLRTFFLTITGTRQGCTREPFRMVSPEGGFSTHAGFHYPRNTRIRTDMAKSDLTDMSITQLQSEIKRREKFTRSLQRRREKLLQQLAEVEAEIATHGALSGGGRGGRRPRNESNLPEALVGVLSGKTMSVTEAAEAVQKAGYITTSPNFRTIVNQALIRDKRFKRVGRGQYTAAAGASSSKKTSKKRKTTKKS
jgi:hypothetical protein